MKTLLGLTVLLCVSACGESDNPEAVATTRLEKNAGASAPAAGSAAPPTAAGKVAACVSLASCCEQLSDARDRASCVNYAASANATTCDNEAEKYCPSSEPAPSAPPRVCSTLASCCTAMATLGDRAACSKMVETGNAISCQDGANIYCPGSGSGQPAGVDACAILSRCCLARNAHQGEPNAGACAQIALDGDTGTCAEAAVDYCN